MFACFGIPTGLLVFRLGFKRFQLKRLIENTPTSKVRSLAMGFCEVNGKIEPFQKTFTAPFTGKNCVWYRYRVEEWRRSGKQHSWQTVMSGEDGAHFSVKDETGAVLVDPAGAEVDVTPDLRSEGTGLDVTTRDRITKFIEERKITLLGGMLSLGSSGGRRRFTEYCLEPGDALYVMGTAGDNPFVEEGTATQGFEDAMIAKGKKHLFYINDKPEKEVTKSLGWQSIGLMAVGAGLSVASLAILLHAFGFL